MDYKKVKHQPVRGHLMALKQFNEPVHCAICKKFIWYRNFFLFFFL